MKEVLITCENCHAKIHLTDAKCPYCSAMNLVGASYEYMEELEEIKDDVGSLDEITKNAYLGEMKKTGKVIRNTLIGLLFVGLFIGILFGVSSCADRRDTLSTEAMLENRLLEKEVFGKLDQYYEAQDYDGMLDYYGNVILDKHYENISIYRWEHMILLEYMNSIRYCNQCLYDMEEYGIRKDDLTYVIVNTTRLLYDDQRDAKQMTEKDLAIVNRYREELGKRVEDNFGITRDELRTFYENSLKEEYGDTWFDYKLCEKAVLPFVKSYLNETRGN